jgi:hypothetical protein
MDDEIRGVLAAYAHAHARALVATQGRTRRADREGSRHTDASLPLIAMEV